MNPSSMRKHLKVLAAVGAFLAVNFTSWCQAGGLPPTSSQSWPHWISGSGYEYLSVKYPGLTWEASFRYPMSAEFIRAYGSGWLPAGSASPGQWAMITNIVRAENYSRGNYGPTVGVVQNVVISTNSSGKSISNEPNGGWYSLIARRTEVLPIATAPAPVFADWASKQPDNGEKKRPWYRRPSFASALTDIFNIGINAVSDGASGKATNLVSFIVGVITAPENKDQQDSGMIFTESDGRVVLKDVSTTQIGGGVILMRPLSAAPGNYPGWPMVNGKVLKDGTVLTRVDSKGKVTTLTWSWAGVPYGKLRLENTDTGVVIYDNNRVTPSWPVGGLAPGKYRISTRRITSKDDPWLSVSFTLGTK